MFPRLNLDDRLWANMIWGGEQLHWMDRGCVNDPVLINLLWIGIFDWLAPNNHLHQTTQAIWHLTALHLRILPRVLVLEDRVGKWPNWGFSSVLTNFLYRWMMSSRNGGPSDPKSFTLNLRTRDSRRRWLSLGARGPGNWQKHVEYIAGSGWRYPPLTCR